MKFRIKYSIPVLFICLLIANFCHAFDKNKSSRTVTLAGLIVDAQSLSPLESAEIFDATNTRIGETDNNGYYKVSINCNAGGELDFKFSVRKRGYKTFNQHEHWADVNSAKAVMYFGLESSNTKTKAFSILGDSRNELDYTAVLSSFGKVRSQQQFKADLEAAKADNEDVFLLVGNKPYIVNRTGWIQLTSDTDLVSIDNKQILPANKLNAAIKRKQVKGMTPVGAVDKKFVVYTR